MIRPAELIRIVYDVARRFPQLRLLELPCDQSKAHVIFPCQGMSGGISSTVMCVFWSGQWDAEAPKDLAAKNNDYKVSAWKTGKAVAVAWTLDTTGEKLNALLVEAAQQIA